MRRKRRKKRRRKQRGKDILVTDKEDKHCDDTALFSALQYASIVHLQYIYRS